MVDEALLSEWSRLRGEAHLPLEQTQMLYPLTTHEQRAIDALVTFGCRVGSFDLHVSSGYHEKGAKERGLIRRLAIRPTAIDEVVIQGTHLSVATPFAKEPNDPFKGGKDWRPIDLNMLEPTAIPRTAYVRNCEAEQFVAAQDKWGGQPYTTYYRLAWRRRIDPKAMERSLYAAIIPPGPTYVHAVHSLALASNLQTALNAGFWASLPLDYQEGYSRGS